MLWVHHICIIYVCIWTQYGFIRALRGPPGPSLGLRLIGKYVDIDISSTRGSKYLVHAREGYIRGVCIYLYM